MNNQKGFIQIPLLIAIIAGVLVLGGGYLGVKQYQNYQAEKVEKEKIIQDKEIQTQKLLISQQKIIEDTSKEIENIKKDNNEIDRLRAEIDNLKNKKPTSENDKLTAIIQEWRPKIAYIKCYWGTNSANSFTKSGSGVLGNDRIITNKHVIEEVNEVADFCSVNLPDDEKVFVWWQNFRISKNIDLAMLIIDSLTPKMEELNGLGISICSEKAPVGSSIVILGYPTIGTAQDITATEGIISGYEGYYYITSAKIEHGNSGGIAILIKSNCELGVPTGVVAGELESLGRIIDLRVAIPLSVR